MAEYQRPQRRSSRRDDDEGVVSPLIPHTGRDISGASEGAQNTISNIDDALRENEEARSLYNSSGDNEPLSGQQLRDQEGGKGTTEPGGDNAPNTSKQGNEDKEDGGSKKSKMGLKGWAQKHKRGLVTGGIVGVLLGGGGFAGFTLMPVIEGGVIVQEAHIFDRPDAKNEHDSASSIRRAFRWARALKKGQYGYARINEYGDIVMTNTLNSLDDIGISFETNTNGSLGKVNIDTDKLKTRYPEIEGMNRVELQDFLRDKFGLTDETGYNLFQTGDKTFAIDARYLDFKATRALAGNTIGQLDDGKIVTAERFRIAAKFWNLPNLLHPWQKAKAKVLNNIADTRSINKERKQDEANRQKAIEDSLSAESQSAVDDTKSKTGGVQGTLTKTLTLTGTACIVYNIADDIVKIDHGRVVATSAARAVDVKAGGSQMEDGSDFESWQPAAMAQSQVDKNGKGIFDSKGWIALSHDGTDQGGVDMPEEYKQAFSGNTTAANIKDGVNTALGGTAPATCSAPGLIIQGLLMVALSAGGDPEVTLAPSVVGKWIVQEGAKFALSGVVMHFVTQFILDNGTTAELAPEMFQGTMGGNLLSYGARAAANTNAIAGGGISLGNTTSTLYAGTLAAQDKKEFEQKNFIARVFDVNDYQTLSGRLAETVVPTIKSGSLTSFASSFLNVGHLFSSMASSLIPKAHAFTPYDWGFPQYGIPDSLLNDPNLQNPYDNANRVVDILNNGGQQYIDKAKSCFGVDITNQNSDHMWDVIPAAEVNPASQDYTDANCGDLTDQNWRRIITFVFDTSTMNAVACYQGQDDACNTIAGKSSSTTASSTTPAPAGSGTTADPFAPSDTMTCPVGTDGGVQDGYHNGQLVKIRICVVQGVQVNARIASNVDALFNAAKAAGINLTGGSGFRTMQDQENARKNNHCPDIYTAPASACSPPTAIPGYSNHQMGEAIDFEQDGKLLLNSMSGFQWLQANAATYGLKNLPSENWHWSVDGN